jgi:hypothetical protein
MQQACLTIDLEGEDQRDALIRHVKADAAWNALYAIREHFGEAYTNDHKFDSRQAYNAVLEILATHKLDLDYHVDPPELGVKI